MTVSKVLISTDIEARLGKDGVAEASASLWPVDCQTCGQALGPRPPALCVDDVGAFAMATLNHERCRSPEWNDGPVTGLSGAHVTHRTRLVMPSLSDLRGTGLGPIPVMLVNPSMENVVLVPDDDGKWHLQMHAVFAAMGMAPPGPDLRLYKPITGATARLTGSAVTITMRMPAPSDAYECALTAGDVRFAEEISSQRGIMLAVTYAADPYSDDDLARQFHEALRAGCVLCGWVSLSGR
jgi:hypothetical protein